MTRTVFDQASRRLALAEPEEFFGWLLKRFRQAVRFERWLQTRTTPSPGDPEQVGDTVAEMASAGDPAPPWLFLLEFQTEPDPDMFGRLLTQGGQLWLDQRPDALPGSRYQLAGAVVNLTGTKASAPASRSYPFPADDGLEWTMKVKEVYLAEESADATLGRVEKGELGRSVLPLVALMHGADDPGIIQRWLGEAGKEPDSRRRDETAGLTKVFVDLKDWASDWKLALKGWNMRESATVNEWKREAVVEALQQTLCRLIRNRFNGLPESVRQRIEATSDPDVLGRGIDQVWTVTRPEDLAL